MTYHHGITAKEVNEGIIPIRTAQTATLGIIVVATDADPIVFPLNKPVLITSVSRALNSSGFDGTLRRTLEAIQPITNPTIVVVRVATTATADVIGTTTAGVRTGIQALLTAKSMLGVVPKILIAPTLENPDVDQAMIAVAKKLRGYYYCTPRDAEGLMLATMELVQAYRDTLGDREIELIWPEFTSGNVLLTTEQAAAAGFNLDGEEALDGSQPLNG